MPGRAVVLEQFMGMQLDNLKEVLSELFALLETQETNSVAVLQLLKDQGIASDEKLSPYLDQAGRASNVKWRAARMRMEYLLTPIQKETTDSKSTPARPKEAQPKQAAVSSEQDKSKNQGKDSGNEKEAKQAPATSARNVNTEKSSDENPDARRDAPENDQNAASKRTA